MYYLGSNSCHVIVCHIFLTKYICRLFLVHLLMIANNTLKQVIIQEYNTVLYHKGMTDPRYLISVITLNETCSQKKTMFFLENNLILVNVIFLILELARYRSRTLVWITFHKQLHPKPHYEVLHKVTLKLYIFI